MTGTVMGRCWKSSVANNITCVPVSHVSEPATGASTPEWNAAMINIISYISVCQVNMYIVSVQPHVEEQTNIVFSVWRISIRFTH